MAIKTKPRIKGEFDWQVPAVVVSLPQGTAAKPLFDAYVEDTDERFGGNEDLKVARYENGQIVGSNVFLNAHLNELLRERGYRTAVPSDDGNGDISRLVQRRFYSDFNALVVRSNKDSYEGNADFLKHLIEVVEDKEGNARFPFMVEGFYVSPREDESYKMGIVPAGNFRVVQDERLDAKKFKTGMKFGEVDKQGLPIFDKAGNRTWYAKDNGVSRFFLDRNLNLNSYGNLANSDGSGRVALVSGEAGAQNLNRLYERRMRDLKERMAKGEAIIERAYQEALKEVNK